MRHARHDENIAVADARRARHAIFDERRAVGHTRHAQPRLGRPAARFIVALQDFNRLRVMDDRDAQSLGNRINRNVVMRRPNAAGRKQIIIARTQLVDRFDDGVFDIGHDADFGEADTLKIEPQRDLRDILVLRAAGQDFVADYGKRGGINAVGCQTISVQAELVEALPFPLTKLTKKDSPSTSSGQTVFFAPDWSIWII